MVDEPIVSHPTSAGELALPGDLPRDRVGTLLLSMVLRIVDLLATINPKPKNPRNKCVIIEINSAA